MSRTSPAVGRVVAILNFFIEHPQQAFTLSQVVKSLRLSRATTHSILMGFVEAGYLYRQPDKSYVLGSILPQLAANAYQTFSPRAVINQEMRALADDYDVVASALISDGDKMRVRERAASVNNLGLARAASGRAYSLYPWGCVFLSKLSDMEIGERLDGAVPPVSKDMRDELDRALDFVRLNGFIVSLSEDDGEGDIDFKAAGRVLDSLDVTGKVRVRFVIAPVAGAEREPAFAISLTGFPQAMSGAEIASVGQRLRETCERISRFIGGDRAKAFYNAEN